MTPNETLSDQAARVAELAERLANQATRLSTEAAALAADSGPIAADGGHGSFLVVGLTVLALACFVGYYVVWNVTPALHSPLMGVTNAISSVIIVGALLGAGSASFGFSKFCGFLAVTLAAVNIFGGFTVTHRMLSMFKRKGSAPAKSH